MSDITMQQARAAVDAARRRSDELSVKMNIAVVDVGTNLKAFARMDGAWLGSIDIAIKKARTARMFDMDTGAIGALSQPGGSLYNIEHSNDGLITFPGGVPIKNSDGEIIGAIGVSGSTVEDDHAVATAGAEAAVPTINPVLVEHVEFTPDPVHDSPHDLNAVQNPGFRAGDPPTTGP